MAALPVAVSSAARVTAEVPVWLVDVVISRCTIPDHSRDGMTSLGWTHDEGEAPRVTDAEWYSDAGQHSLADPGEAQRVDACLQSFSWPAPHSESWRSLTEHERMVADSWVESYARPCAGANGLDHPEVIFQHSDDVGLSMLRALGSRYETSELPVERLVAIGQACPILPPSLPPVAPRWW